MRERKFPSPVFRCASTDRGRIFFVPSVLAPTRLVGSAVPSGLLWPCFFFLSTYIRVPPEGGTGADQCAHWSAGGGGLGAAWATSKRRLCLVSQFVFVYRLIWFDILYSFGWLILA